MVVYCWTKQLKHLYRNMTGTMENPDLELIQSIKRASDMYQFFLVPLSPLGPLMFPSLLGEVQQDHRPGGSGDREAIVV